MDQEQRIRLLESQLEILKQFTDNLSQQQLRILEIIDKILENDTR